MWRPAAPMLRYAHAFAGRVVAAAPPVTYPRFALYELSGQCYGVGP
jgi:hypothetical protein